MKMIIALVLGAVALNLRAQNESLDSNSEPAPTSTSLFKAKELTLDLYGNYTAAEPHGITHLFDTNARHGKYGAGLGATYWMTRYVGAGLDVTIPDAGNLHGLFFDQVSWSLTARLPLGHVAPYALAGVGRNFESSLWNTHVGVGLEWRPSPGRSPRSRNPFPRVSAKAGKEVSHEIQRLEGEVGKLRDERREEVAELHQKVSKVDREVGELRASLELNNQQLGRIDPKLDRMIERQNS
jgi:hypothetical protein